MTVTNSDQTQLNPQAHVELGQRFLHPDDKPRQFYAPARTISSILHDAGLFKIDLFSLDLEGFEAAALRGLDLLRFDIRVFCIETANIDGITDVLGTKYKVAEQISYHDYILIKTNPAAGQV